MPSKVQRQKDAQGYTLEPHLRVCSTCKFFKFNTEIKNYDYYGITKSYERKLHLRCSFSATEFVVNKTAACWNHEFNETKS